MSWNRKPLIRRVEEELTFGARYLIAVSGGVDSVSLLHLCLELSGPLKLSLGIAHVDHGIRSDSHRDAELVRELSAKYGLPFFLKDKISPPDGENVEAWGRGIRYSFFGEILKSRGYDSVLTAHTADDLAETFLMRLLSNKETRTIRKFEPKFKALRPLLSITKEEIRSYATSEDLPFHEDSTNQDRSYLRNRIRNELIPYMKEKFEGDISSILANEAVSWEEMNDYLTFSLEPALSESKGVRFGCREWLRIVVDAINSFEFPILKNRFVEELFFETLGYRLGRRRSVALVEFLIGHDDGIELPGKVVLRRQDGGITVLKNS